MRVLNFYGTGGISARGCEQLLRPKVERAGEKAVKETVHLRKKELFPEG